MTNEDNDARFKQTVVEALGRQSAEHQNVRETLSDLKGLINNLDEKLDELHEDSHQQAIRLTVIETKALTASNKSVKAQWSSLIAVIMALVGIVGKALGALIGF